MDSKCLIVDKLNIFIIFKLIKHKKVFYLKPNLISKILIFKKIKKLKWNISNAYIEGKNPFTYILEKKERDKFINNFINLEKNFFQDLTENEKIYFKNYLNIALSVNTNTVGNLSLNEFLVFFYYIKNYIKGEKTIVLRKNIFYDFFQKIFKEKNIKYEFYQLAIFPKTSFKVKQVIKALYYYFFTKKNKLDFKGQICLLDSFRINQPSTFFNIKNVYDNTVFCSHSFYKNNIYCIKNNLKIETIKNYLKSIFNKKFNTKNYFLENLFHLFLIEKNIYLDFFIDKKIKIFVNSALAQSFSAAAAAASKELNIDSIGFTNSLNTRYANHLGIKSFDFFINYTSLDSDLEKDGIVNLKFGYLGDYKFKKYQNKSLEFKENLKKNKNNFIIGFFDQGSFNDPRFGLRFEDSQKIGYEFLLNKLIEDKNLILLIKPKKPKLFKEIYSHCDQKFSELINKAKNTKRCIFFDDNDTSHVKNFNDIPAKVAFSSDITIHDTMLASTAGLESALTGTRSVLFDYYNTNNHYIFKRKNLDIVYESWPDLWDSIQNFRNGKNTSLGDWSNIIDTFDKFRDGRANERLQKFILKKL